MVDNWGNVRSRSIAFTLAMQTASLCGGDHDDFIWLISVIHGHSRAHFGSKIQRSAICQSDLSDLHPSCATSWASSCSTFALCLPCGQSTLGFRFLRPWMVRSQKEEQHGLLRCWDCHLGWIQFVEIWTSWNYWRLVPPYQPCEHLVVVTFMFSWFRTRLTWWQATHFRTGGWWVLHCLARLTQTRKSNGWYRREMFD